MVSEFFFPKIGGVESHIYNISVCLIEMGHKVVILTKEFKDKNMTGVRHFSNGIKVYYLPFEKI